MWRILYPIQYFRLSNADKRRIDLIPTLLLGLVLAAPFVFLDGPSFFRANGFLDRVLTLTTALTGSMSPLSSRLLPFYILISISQSKQAQSC